jgi:hypothetical protein
MSEIQCNCNGPLCASCGPKYQQATIQPGKKLRVNYGGVAFETPEPEVEKLRHELVGLAESIRGHDGCECSTREFDCGYHNAIIEKATAIIDEHGGKGGGDE